ncbi:MAG: DoxX family protein [Sphingomonadaceae bacterium]|nr:DoxX family protein [Sphingomonadaceae bacterium]
MEFSFLPESYGLFTLTPYILKIFLTGMFLFAGFGNWFGIPLMYNTFEKIGQGHWFRYVTGTLQLSAVVLLWANGFTLYGALMLAVIMGGAVVAHFIWLTKEAIEPSIVLTVLSLLLAWMHLPIDCVIL